MRFPARVSASPDGSLSRARRSEVSTRLEFAAYSYCFQRACSSAMVHTFQRKICKLRAAPSRSARKVSKSARKVLVCFVAPPLPLLQLTREGKEEGARGVLVGALVLLSLQKNDLSNELGLVNIKVTPQLETALSVTKPYSSSLRAQRQRKHNHHTFHRGFRGYHDSNTAKAELFGSGCRYDNSKREMGGGYC
eukprot:2692123-Rhodomonas_salina.1